MSVCLPICLARLSLQQYFNCVRAARSLVTSGRYCLVNLLQSIIMKPLDLFFPRSEKLENRSLFFFPPPLIFSHQF